ncbi:MAG: hypothetical protein QXL38_00760 [Candidatus Bathyarchaeia archaeon]
MRRNLHAVAGSNPTPGASNIVFNEPPLLAFSEKPCAKIFDYCEAEL